MENTFGAQVPFNFGPDIGIVRPGSRVLRPAVNVIGMFGREDTESRPDQIKIPKGHWIKRPNDGLMSADNGPSTGIGVNTGISGVARFDPDPAKVEGKITLGIIISLISNAAIFSINVVVL